MGRRKYRGPPNIEEGWFPTGVVRNVAEDGQKKHYKKPAVTACFPFKGDAREVMAACFPFKGDEDYDDADDDTAHANILPTLRLAYAMMQRDFESVPRYLEFRGEKLGDSHCDSLYLVMQIPEENRQSAMRIFKRWFAINADYRPRLFDLAFE